MAELIDPIVELSEETLEQLCTELGSSRESIEKMPTRRLLRALTKLEIRDRPRARLEYEHDMLCDDSGEIPVAAQEHALAQLSELRSASRRVSREIAGIPVGEVVFSVDARMEGPTAGLNANNTGWTALGPGNIGGRTRAIAIDPTDTTRLYAAGVGGGVWRSTDSGDSWLPTDDLMANLAVCSLVMDPTGPNTLYAGTGEGFLNVDAIRGNGIFTTTDGGATWSQIASTSANADFFYVNALAI